jgi:hypothetical protein
MLSFLKKKKTSDGMICPSRQSLSQQIRVGGEDLITHIYPKANMCAKDLADLECSLDPPLIF